MEIFIQKNDEKRKQKSRQTRECAQRIQLKIDADRGRHANETPQRRLEMEMVSLSFSFLFFLVIVGVCLFFVHFGCVRNAHERVKGRSKKRNS